MLISFIVMVRLEMGILINVPRLEEQQGGMKGYCHLMVANKFDFGG
ncbi:MAG: hypothetical protein UT14_C0020G0013 [Candidatus Shapirobacteria bacterium GW2011_GWE1_38_92]|uniref:Uncharacterized protein n=1 Tax=Candidatus Shapirobacteria bacterium GW2011_GWE1_38_92 TaxID=1618489 RepID=A0A0G0PPF4_9BACT|nr:MAG: hypothetical protein UT14_C0020G0013 [Candidatus Shapirobacteria bacterium GW2011_GWE1_38_92]